MKRSLGALLVLLLALFALAAPAQSEEQKMIGVVAKVEVAAGGRSATATVTDNKTGADVKVLVTDDLTLEKFKDKRIVEGDEVRVKFEVKDGANTSTYFRKTAGC